LNSIFILNDFPVCLTNLLPDHDKKISYAKTAIKRNGKKPGEGKDKGKKSRQLERRSTKAKKDKSANKFINFHSFVKMYTRE
jgi:hypothetical protein